MVNKHCLEAYACLRGGQVRQRPQQSGGASGSSMIIQVAAAGPGCLSSCAPTWSRVRDSSPRRRFREAALLSLPPLFQSLRPPFSLGLASTPATDWPLTVSCPEPQPRPPRKPRCNWKERKATGSDQGLQVSICTLFTQSVVTSRPCVRASLWTHCASSGPKTTRLRTFPQGTPGSRQGWAFLSLIINKNSTLKNIYIYKN